MLPLDCEHLLTTNPGRWWAGVCELVRPAFGDMEVHLKKGTHYGITHRESA
jgi:hypothetical protein